MPRREKFQKMVGAPSQKIVVAPVGAPVSDCKKSWVPGTHTNVAPELANLRLICCVMQVSTFDK